MLYIYKELNCCCYSVQFVQCVSTVITETTCLLVRNGDEWYKTRRALAPKMLRPKEVKDNTDSFNAVNLDMVKALRQDRNENNEILDFGPQINRWSTECK